MEKTRVLRDFVRAFQGLAALELALGLVVLGYAVVEEPTLRMFRGAAVLVLIGVAGLLWAPKWLRVPLARPEAWTSATRLSW